MKKKMFVVISLLTIVLLSGCTNISEERFLDNIFDVYDIEITNQEYLDFTVKQREPNSEFIIGITNVKNLNVSSNYVLTTLDIDGKQTDMDLTGLVFYKLEMSMGMMDNDGTVRYAVPFFSIVLKEWNSLSQNYKAIGSILIETR